MDGIARLNVAAGEDRISIEREIGYRHGADTIKDPGHDAFHQEVVSRGGSRAADVIVDRRIALAGTAIQSSLRFMAGRP
jgi:hypothetical protein